eukprot:1529601-Rhodomonas_salina.4
MCPTGHCVASLYAPTGHCISSLYGAIGHGVYLPKVSFSDRSRDPFPLSLHTHVTAQYQVPRSRRSRIADFSHRFLLLLQLGRDFLILLIPIRPPSACHRHCIATSVPGLG